MFGTDRWWICIAPSLHTSRETRPRHQLQPHIPRVLLLQMRLASLQYPGSGVISTSRMRSEDLVPAAHGALEADQLAVGVWRMCRERSRQVTTPAPAPCGRIGGRIFDQPFRGQGRRDELGRGPTTNRSYHQGSRRPHPHSWPEPACRKGPFLLPPPQAARTRGRRPPGRRPKRGGKGGRWKYCSSLRGPVGVLTAFRSMSRELYLSRSGRYI